MIDFSVVATVYNDEREIKELLDDISGQSCRPKEIIIVDGGSADATCKIIREYSAADINLIRGKRYNIAQGLNTAIKAAKTKWIVIMAAGNHYEKNYCEALILALTGKEKEADGTYGALDGRTDTFFGRLYHQLFIQKDVGVPTNHGALLKKELFEEIGYFYEGFVYAGEDLEFYIRALKNNKLFLYTDQTTVVWDTPQNYKEYFKQRDRYILSELQIFSNSMIFHIYKNQYRNHIVYFLLIMLALALIRTRGGIVLLSGICMFNLLLMIRKGVVYCIAKNVQAFTNMVCFIKNIKYWKKKNKIDNEYIIRKVEKIK